MAIALGTSSEPTTPAERALAEYVALIQTHFRPRRERLPVFSDAELAGLGMPVLAIVGARDAMLASRDTRRRLEANAPRATVDFLPDAGHLIRGKTARILDFLSQRIEEPLREQDPDRSSRGSA